LGVLGGGITSIPLLLAHKFLMGDERLKKQGRRGEKSILLKICLILLKRYVVKGGGKKKKKTGGEPSPSQSAPFLGSGQRKDDEPATAQTFIKEEDPKKKTKVEQKGAVQPLRNHRQEGKGGISQNVQQGITVMKRRGRRKSKGI